MRSFPFACDQPGLGRLAGVWIVLAIGSIQASSAQDRGPTTKHVVDIGSADDELFVGEGIYSREGANLKSAVSFYRENSMRWFGNRWTMRLPVFARRDNRIELSARFSRRVELTLGDGWTVTLDGRGDDSTSYAFVLPADAVGEQELIEVYGVCSPPYMVPSDRRDARQLAMAVARVTIAHTEISESDPRAVRAPDAAEHAGTPERFINLGLDGDEPFVVDGIYQREGPLSWSKDPLARWASFRWFSSQWGLRLPVFPQLHNEIVIRARSSRPIRVTCDGQLVTWLFPAAAPHYEMRLIVPAERIGDRSEIELNGVAIPPVPAESGQRDLAMLADWVRIRPLDEIPADMMPIADLSDQPEADLPLSFRLRGTESRPLFTDIEAYVHEARLMRCNVMTIGPMNGQHWTAFPTQHGIPHPKMQAEFLPQQVAALHRWGIAAIGWLPFNVQDLRRTVDCQAAAKYPQWKMQYIDWPERPAADRVGMCVVSSPWRQMHAEILKEAAATGIDGVFFDGFYLGGIPHPISPGCVCPFCQDSFRRDTGLETPARVDWTDITFKRWIRWRNEKLLEVAAEFRDKMRESKPGLQVTCNWNIWPFGDKDWDTGIPLWSQDDLGTSQHAYTGRPDLEWVMMGFKARLSHDLNPRHSDIWRTSRPAWNYDGSDADQARHELTMRTFMLSGLTYGTTPWHGEHIQPAEIGIRVHQAVQSRERFFGQDHLRHIGVVLSQNTHDFYGHLPGTTNRDDYRDTTLGTWLLLTERHAPFRWVFDNEIEDESLSAYDVLLLPNTACLSDGMLDRLNQYVAHGGRIVATADAGWYDQWGQRRAENRLTQLAGIRHFDGEPSLAWLRSRDTAAADRLIDALMPGEWPLQVEAPPWLVVNASWAPTDPKTGQAFGEQTSVPVPISRTLWIHLLNVSAFYPAGDTGFRGMGADPVYAGAVASDAQIAHGGRVVRVNTPVKNIVIAVPGLSIDRAQLAIAGTEIAPSPDGTFVIPEVDIHDVLVLECR
ncbi:MAG: beta-galactosidase trimerization domain-containing protein [Pirellulaceae bacterium]|nr:beta-galactosidase trimerization domain-containing protein [Pirellulaceae bacterium]